MKYAVAKTVTSSVSIYSSRDKVILSQAEAA
jgi:hypothetical protein